MNSKQSRAVWLVPLLVLGIVASSNGRAGAKEKANAGTYRNRQQGFSISLPAFAQKKLPSVQLAQFFGPIDGGFSANVNVIAQYTGISIKQFINLSKTQFESLGITVTRIKETRVGGQPAVELEYEGTMQGTKLSFVVLAVRRKDHILMITGTSLASKIGKYRALLWKSVRSVRVK